MRPEDRVRLRHLTEAATKAIDYGATSQRSDLDDNELLRLALTKLVEIVGEAAKHVSRNCAARALMFRGAQRPGCGTG